MVDSIAESARKASAGTWRKPRVRIYDYNQDIGSNYYQPMIKYIHDKEIYGPYLQKKTVELPERATLGSNKYTNMRYEDKSNANMDLDDFLVRAYAKQIKELNSSTASTHYMMMHNKKEPTFFNGNFLLGSAVRANDARQHWLKEVTNCRRKDWQEELAEAQFEQERLDFIQRQNAKPSAQEIEALNKEFAKDARAKMFWIYRTRDMKELKQWLDAQ